MEYTTSVSSRMYIDRSGCRLEAMDVQVDGYRDNSALADAMAAYNRGEEIPERWERAHENSRPSSSPELRCRDWRRRLWRLLYAGMVGNARRWRRRRL